MIEGIKDTGKPIGWNYIVPCQYDEILVNYAYISGNSSFKHWEMAYYLQGSAKYHDLEHSSRKPETQDDYSYQKES